MLHSYPVLIIEFSLFRSFCSHLQRGTHCSHFDTCTQCKMWIMHYNTHDTHNSHSLIVHFSASHHTYFTAHKSVTTMAKVSSA